MWTMRQIATMKIWQHGVPGLICRPYDALRVREMTEVERSLNSDFRTSKLAVGSHGGSLVLWRDNESEQAPQHVGGGSILGKARYPSVEHVHGAVG